MVDVIADRDALRQFRHAAEMVAMPVRGDQIVDLGQTGVAGRRHDALGVAHRRVGRHIAGIDQHRLARGRNEQRRLAAFDVDHINIQSGPRLRRGAILSGLDHQCGQTSSRREHVPHGNLPLGRGAGEIRRG